MVEDPFQLSPSSIDSEKYEKRISSSSSSVIRSSVRKSAVRGRFWSAFRFRRRVGIGSMMILAIVVLSLVFALGKCGPLERRHRRQATITLNGVSRLDFFDANSVQRGAATMGGRIKMRLDAPDLQCTTGAVSLFDDGGKFLGEGLCSSATWNPPIEFNVTDELTLGKFKIKINEVESQSFESHIFYVLVNRPIDVKECGSGEVYAKIVGGTQCTKLDPTKWCEKHLERSSKFGCPASDGGKKSYCYGVGTEDQKPTSETDKAKNLCKGSNLLENPYITYGIPSVPNDGLIKMNKTQPTITVNVPSGSTGKFEYKIDRFDGNPIEGNGSFTNGEKKGFNVSFDEPFKAVLEVKTTFDDGYEFITRLDLICLETDMEVEITANCNQKTGTCTQYEAIGKLAEFCKRTKDVICGMKIGNQIHQSIVVPDVKMENGEAPKAIIFFGWYTWNGQEFVNKTFAEIGPGVTWATEATTSSSTGSGNNKTDDQRIRNTTRVFSTRAIPNSTTPNSFEKPTEYSDQWIWIVGGVGGAAFLLIVVGIVVGVWWYKKSKTVKLTNEWKKAHATVEKNAPLPKEPKEGKAINELLFSDQIETEIMLEAKDVKAAKDNKLTNPCFAKNQVGKLNASLMKDPYGLPQVISQAPTPEEMFSFWSHIMELKVGVLVVNGELYDGDTYFVGKINAAFPSEANKSYTFTDDTKGETIKVSTTSKTEHLGRIIKREITVVKEGKRGKKMAKKTITALQLPEFVDSHFDLKEEEVRTLAIFAFKVYEEQLDQIAKGLPGVWIHCRAGLERSAILATLHQSLQIIVKLGHVNVRHVMRHIRSNRLGTFSRFGDKYGTTKDDKYVHMIDLIENRAIPLLVKWSKEGQTFSDLCIEDASASNVVKANKRKTASARKSNVEPAKDDGKSTAGKSMASTSQIKESPASTSQIGTPASTSKIGKSTASTSQVGKSKASSKKK